MQTSAMKGLVVALGTAVMLWSGCDEGLSPVSATVPTGFMSGTIRYHHWPPLDSLVDLRLVAFRLFPPTNIVNEVLLGRAVVFPPLGDTALVPFFVDSLRYTISLPAGEYKYVVVAQRYGPGLFTDWRPVGQYDLDSNLAVPSSVVITANDTTQDVNISVDFAHPPPPPFDKPMRSPLRYREKE